MGWSLVVASWWEGLTRVVGFWLKDWAGVGAGLRRMGLVVGCCCCSFSCCICCGLFFSCSFCRSLFRRLVTVEFRNFHDVGMIGDRLGIC